MEQEIWKFIEGFEKYQISSYGRVRSFKNNKESILKPGKVGSGYYKVGLYKNNISKQFLIHRLVANAFITNPENEPQVNHKNGLKTDNHVTNLEWVTAKENIHHGWKTGLMENARKSGKKNAIIANESRKMPIFSSKLNMQFESVRYASRYIQKTYHSNTNVETIKVSIHGLLKGRMQTSIYDYGWEYIDKINNSNN